MTEVDDPLARLRAIVGPPHLLTDAGLVAPYERDWTGRFGGRSLAVARPGSTREVVALLGFCRDAGIPVIPQGGNTGLVGGSVPRGDTRRHDPIAEPAERPAPRRPSVGAPVILSTSRLNVIAGCDAASGLIQAGAGTTLGDAQRAAATIGQELGIDLAARDSATLGGMVATNAGGMHVVRHGSMRARVVGLEAVLADGSVVRRMDGLWKDNVGWSLVSLLSGRGNARCRDRGRRPPGR